MNEDKEKTDNKVAEGPKQEVLTVTIPWQLAEEIQQYLQTRPIQEAIKMFGSLGALMDEVLKNRK